MKRNRYFSEPSIKPEISYRKCVILPLHLDDDARQILCSDILEHRTYIQHCLFTGPNGETIIAYAPKRPVSSVPFFNQRFYYITGRIVSSNVIIMVMKGSSFIDFTLKDYENLLLWASRRSDGLLKSGAKS